MRKEVFIVGEYHHIYNRGVDKRDIFCDDRDRLRFVHTLYILNNFVDIPYNFDVVKLEPRELLHPRKNPLVRIVAGCLMSNHFHLMLTPLEEGGVSKFLHKVGVSYTKYFNKLHERSGSLFESTFKAKHVDSHEYAAYLSQYIHLNPVELFQGNRKNAWQKLMAYQWSTLHDYLGDKSRLSLLIDGSFRDEVLDMTPKEYKDFLFELYNR